MSKKLRRVKNRVKLIQHEAEYFQVWRINPSLGCACTVGQLYLFLHDPVDSSPWLLCPWDFSDKNTGVGCHFLFQVLWYIPVFHEERQNILTSSCLSWVKDSHQQPSLPTSHLEKSHVRNTWDFLHDVVYREVPGKEAKYLRHEQQVILIGPKAMSNLLPGCCGLSWYQWYWWPIAKTIGRVQVMTRCSTSQK